MRSADLIAAERQRQIDAEGYTPEHDAATNGPGTLFAAARAYADADAFAWPFGDATWKPKNRLRDLIRAGALAVAAQELAVEQGKKATADLCQRLHDKVVAEVDGILAEAGALIAADIESQAMDLRRTVGPNDPESGGMLVAAHIARGET